jgi:hypothetical protein
MDIWTPSLLLLGLSGPGLETDPIEAGPVVQTVAIISPPLTSTPPDLTEPIVIDIKYQPGQRCLIAATTLIIQRNLTLPYYQQVVYGTTQCQNTASFKH